MDKLDFRTIVDKKTKEKVVEKIHSYTGVMLPESYVNQSRIVGVFLHDQMVAGYMLVTRPGFRSLLFVPDRTKQENELLSNSQSEFMEVNGLWISPALKKPSLQMRVWFNLVWDIFSCGKKYVLLMRNLNNKSMERFMAMSNPTSIYEGEPFVMAGQETHEKIEVSYTTRWSLVTNSYKYIAELARRNRKATNFARQNGVVKSLKGTYSNLGV